MRRMALSLALMAAVANGVVFGKARHAADGEALGPPGTLKLVNDFASIKDEAARSAALFAEAGKELQHPRCLNCHPSGDRPTQHEAMTPHESWVVRGVDGMGVAAMRCNIPALFVFGADWFRKVGTEKSGGTKVFALAGKIITGQQAEIDQMKALIAG